jgi:diacylglycerol kinase family enzyme
VNEKKRIHVVVNPAAGKDEPILNTINDVFHEHGIEWGVSVTRKYGDATEFARQAAETGFDIVAGYGGDGTQHEIANGLMGSKAIMGILPGGTGNGYANELGTPKKLRPALELLCGNHKVDQRGHTSKKLRVRAAIVKFICLSTLNGA